MNQSFFLLLPLCFLACSAPSPEGSAESGMDSARDSAGFTVAGAADPRMAVLDPENPPDVIDVMWSWDGQDPVWVKGMLVGDLVMWDDIVLGRWPEILEPKADFPAPPGVGIASTSSGRWTSCTVPYEIDPNFSATDRQNILDAIAYWNSNTVMQVTPRNGEANYVYFTFGTTTNSCSSWVGMQGGSQNIHTTISGYCDSASLVHEIGHAVGLMHEHTRSDRDLSVSLNPSNFSGTATAWATNFQVSTGPTYQDYGSYDFDSTMQYDSCSFSICPSCGQGSGSACWVLETLGGGYIPRNAGNSGPWLSPGDLATVESIYTVPGYVDSDGDGHGGSQSGDVCFDTHVPPPGDCNDASSSVYPGAPEVCNNIDDDCDGAVDNGAGSPNRYYRDADGDGYGAAGQSLLACSTPAGYVADKTDCDDGNPAVHPGAAEVCNYTDDDCNGQMDDGSGAPPTWYRDHDVDGHGVWFDFYVDCTAPSGYTGSSDDCDDARAATYPGATEFCNHYDDDCDGSLDEADAADATTWYQDADNDGFGNPGFAQNACALPAGFVADATDCDDQQVLVSPVAPEHCNGQDDNCDGDVDEESAVEAGYWYADQDGDGYGSGEDARVACTAPGGYVARSTDCNDADATIHPEATEVCDPLAVDEDCDGLADDQDLSLDPSSRSLWMPDEDSDGYGDTTRAMVACRPEQSDWIEQGGDCDDTRVDTHPGAPEVCDPEDRDEDCNGLADDADPGVSSETQGHYYLDGDGDGFGNREVEILVCDPLAREVVNRADCDDNDPTIHPGAEELRNGIDADCDTEAKGGILSCGGCNSGGAGGSFLVVGVAVMLLRRRENESSLCV